MKYLTTIAALCLSLTFCVLAGLGLRAGCAAQAPGDAAQGPGDATPATTTTAQAPSDGEYGPIGINLAGNADWGTAHIWADAAHDFRHWGQVDHAWVDDAHLTYTPQGYPLQDAAALSYLTNYPDGVYHLSWQGAGDVLAGGIGSQGRILRQNGIASADVFLRHDNPNHLTGGMLFLSIRHNDPHDPVHEVHLWSPGSAAGALFAEDFVRRVRPFAAIRFMDWASTNNSPQVHWADRPQPQSMIWTDGGIPWETMIALCNQVGRDMWINLPAKADDNYAKELATLIKSSLPSPLKVRVEYSNEVWNAIFAQFAYNLEQARHNAALDARDDLGRCAQQYALRAKQIGDIFRSVWGDQSGRLIFVLGGQAGNPSWCETGLQYVNGHFGAPRNFFQEIAIAPYVGDQLGQAPPAGWTLDALFPVLEQFTATTLMQWIGDARNSANRWGLGLSAYEGGQTLSSMQSLPKELLAAAQQDPRMGRLYHDIVRAWHANGGGCFFHFSHIRPGWGLLESSTAPGSPKWDALLDMILTKGDANLDGKVDYQDFLILKANWGRRDAWWEQGDFNGDRVVDAADLQLLCDHLRGLTPAQQAEVDAFRAAHAK